MPKITIRVVNPGKQETQVVSELSFGNLFIRSERFLPVGSRVQVVVHLPSAAPESLALEGRVARIVDDEAARARKACGMALDVDLDDTARVLLSAVRAKLQMPPVAFLHPSPPDLREDAARLFEDLRQFGASQEAAPGVAQFESTQPGIVPAPHLSGPSEASLQLTQRVAGLEAALAEREAEKARHEEAMKKLYVELATLRASARPTSAARHEATSPSPGRAVFAGLGGVVAGAALVFALVVGIRPDLSGLPAMPWHTVEPVTAQAAAQPAAQPAAPVVAAEPPAEAEPTVVEPAVVEPPEPVPAQAQSSVEAVRPTPPEQETLAPSLKPKAAPARSGRPAKVRVAPARGPLSPEAGTIELRADQPATAFVNGRRAGPTPVRMRVNPGRVSVRFDCEVEHVTVHGTGRSVRVPPKGKVNVDYECTK